jgi:hypothetical protein
MLLRDRVLRLSFARIAAPRIVALAGVLALAGLAAPAAQAAEHVLTRAEVTKLAKDHAILCEGWRDLDESCQSLLFLDMSASGDITETDRMQLAEEPDVAVGIKNPVFLDGAAVCTTVDFGAGHTVILMDGEPSDNEMAAGFLEALKLSLAAYDGKRACETFRRDDVTGAIKSSTTIDGRPAPELESNYRLLPENARVRLRPLIEGDHSEQSI